jgi:hypothetical protein
MIDTKSHTGTDHRYKSITRDQSKDTGMALVLIFLILGQFFPERAGLFHICAITALVIDMVWPAIYKPAAWLWFGFAHILGTLVSKLLLAIVFIFLVTPVGIVRSILGKDTLLLKRWKKNELSVFHVRDHSFRPEDVEKPY